MAHSTGKIAIVADTPTQIAGTVADVASTRGRTSGVRFTFIPDTTPAVVQVGSEAAVTADEGFVFFADAELGTTETFNLVADEDLWFVATEAGELRWFRE